MLWFNAYDYQTRASYSNRLRRCRAAALIETISWDGIGTGFPVRCVDFHRALPPIVLITNPHIVSEERDAAVNFMQFHGLAGAGLEQAADGPPLVPLGVR